MHQYDPPPPAPPRRLATTIHLGARSGYGVFGSNLAVRAAQRGIPLLPLGPCDWQDLSPQQQSALAPTKASLRLFHLQWQPHLDAAQRDGNEARLNFDGDLLVYLLNHFRGANFPYHIRTQRIFAVTFLENPHLTPAAVALGNSMTKIFAGSRWNGDLLRRAGLTNITVAPQGIDPDLFFPRPSTGKYKNRFVIFSGGKLEYRKGHDLVVAAMRKFSQSHPDAILIFAWDHTTADLAAEMNHAGHLQDTPAVQLNGRAEFSAWLTRNGVEHFVDLGPQLNWQMPDILREADVAIFPNRCEGGTNLVAMEAMACGVPTILSANTGHLDIISDQTSYPLHSQDKVAPTPLCPNVDQWGESSVEEICETLRQIYTDRTEANRRAQAGADAMAKLTWANQIDLIFKEMNRG